MQRAGAGLENHRHGASGGEAVIRAVVGSEGAELGDSVCGRGDAHAAGAAAVVIFAAVQQIDVVILAHAVEFDAGIAAHRSVNHTGNLAGGAGSQRGELIDAAPIDGDLRHLLAGDDVALFAGVLLNADGVGFDGNGFRGSAKLQLEIDTSAITDLQQDVFLFRCFEAVGFGLDDVMTDVRVRDYILTGIIGRDGLAEPGFDVGRRDLDVGDDRARRIGDRADDRGFLSESENGQPEKKNAKHECMAFGELLEQATDTPKRFRGKTVHSYASTPPAIWHRR